MATEVDTHRGKLFAAAWRGDLELVKEVVEAKVLDVNTPDSDGVTALRFSAQFGHLEITRYLLDHGANPNFAAKDQMDPLLSAVDYGQKDVVELLINRGANVHTKTSSFNAVLLAQEKGHQEIEKLLIDAGATDNMGVWFKIRKRVSKLCRIKG